MTKKSYVWRYFTELDHSSARCKLCPDILLKNGGSTKGMRKHLESLHGITEHDSQEVVAPPAKKQKTILDFAKYSTLNETIARQVCDVGLNFNQIAQNEYLRINLERDFKVKVPKHPSNIAEHFYSFYEEVKKQTIDQIGKMREKGHKFSATLDEWTACSNKRYLNINLHFHEKEESKLINLGLIPIKGSCDALHLKELVSLFFNFSNYLNNSLRIV